MRLLLDTQILLRMATEPEKLSAKAQSLLSNGDNQLVFSVISIWEVTIKRAQDRSDFRADPRSLRDNLLAEDCQELMLTSDHSVVAGSLPLIHKDPFDRALIAQASVERLSLLTTDRQIGRYPGDILLV